MKLAAVLLGTLALAAVEAWPLASGIKDLFGGLHTGTQRYSIKLRLLCGKEPAGNTQVKLMEHDTGPDPDDELDEGRTNADGFIELSGETFEGSSIDPRLEVYTDCNDKNRLGIPNPCQRKWKIYLPDKYINKPVMDLGTLNLEMKLKDEDRDCIH